MKMVDERCTEPETGLTKSSTGAEGVMVNSRVVVTGS